MASDIVDALAEFIEDQIVKLADGRRGIYYYRITDADLRLWEKTPEWVLEFVVKTSFSIIQQHARLRGLNVESFEVRRQMAGVGCYLINWTYS